MQRNLTVALVATLAFATSLLPLHASEFGPGFGSAYEFRSANDLAARAGILDLIERKKAGFYQPSVVNVSNTTNIAGDQVNCDVSSTTVGNTGTALNTGESGAPTVLNSPSVTSAASGNVAGGEAGGPLNAGGSLGQNNVDTSQSVDGSTQNASIGSSDQGGVAGEVGGSNNSLQQSADNQQSVSASPLNSSIAGSSACSWVKSE